MGPERSGGGTLIPVTVSLMMVVVVAVLGAGTEGQQTCRKFSDLRLEETSLQCEAVCATPRELYNHGVFGTSYYTPDSEVCVAATHAGVLGLEGGRVSFTKINNHGNISRGTLRNRVKSMSKSSGSQVKFKFEATEEIIKTEDLAGDVIVVHNSYSGGDTLRLSCLADGDSRTLDNNDIMTWAYVQMKHSLVTIIEAIYANKDKRCIFPTTEDGETYYRCIPSSVLGQRDWCYTDYDGGYDRCTRSPSGKAVIATLSIVIDENSRAFRCRGVTPATDVLAVIKRPDQMYTSSASSMRATVGNNLTVAITRNNPKTPNKVFVRRLPDSWPYGDSSTSDTDLPLTFGPVSMEDDGIYILGNDKYNSNFKVAKERVEANGDYFHLSVQKCPAGRYGIRCENWCPDCENGGMCHAATGSCVCPPGFKGPTCKDACTAGSFGHDCQLQCDRKYLGFDPPSNKICKNLTFCVPEPYGCSCAPGYTGPFCNQECEPGQYGAGCYLRCNYCEGQMCNHYSGQCDGDGGCVEGVACNDFKPLDLPRLRVPPTIMEVLEFSAILTFSHWDQELDDGSNFFPVTGYVVKLRGEGDAEWKEVWSSGTSHDSTSKQVPLTNLQSGRKYSVKVLVKTADGVVDGITNKRVHTITFTTPCTGAGKDVVNLTASNITKTSAVLEWNGRHKDCGVTYEVKVEADGRIVVQSPPDSEHSFTPVNLELDKKYIVTVTAFPSQYTDQIYFVTLPNAPETPVLEMEGKQSKTLDISFRLPDNSAQADNFEVEYKLMGHQACRDGADEVTLQRFNTTTSPTHLEDLESYAVYSVCVTATNRGGPSQETCNITTTLPDAPTVTVPGFKCISKWQNRASCDVQLSGGCQDYNGPNIMVTTRLQTSLTCLNTLHAVNKSYEDIGTSKKLQFTDLHYGHVYKASVSVYNDAGTGETKNTTFTTPDAKASAVMNLSAVVLNLTSVRLQWNDPCPSTGTIIETRYRIIKYRNQRTKIQPAECSNSLNYTRCYTINDLKANIEYSIEVGVKTSSNSWGPSSTVKFTIKEKKPGPPAELSVGRRQTTSLTLTIHLPVAPGGVLLNCTVNLPAITFTRTVNVSDKHLPSVEVSGLKGSTQYTVEASFCNSVDCSEPLKKNVTTLLLPSHLQRWLNVSEVGNTNITLTLPRLPRQGDETRTMIVMVQHITESNKDVHPNFTTEYLKLGKSNQADGQRRKREVTGGGGPLMKSTDNLPNQADGQRRRRQMTGGGCDPPKETYIAAVIDQEAMSGKFVVGNNANHGGYHNCPLKTRETYMVALVEKVALEDQIEYMESRLSAPVKVEYNDSSVVLNVVLTIFCLILAVIIIAGLVYYYKRQYPEQMANWKARFDRSKVEEAERREAEFFGNASMLHLQPQTTPSPSPTAPLGDHHTPQTQATATPKFQKRGAVRTRTDIAPPPASATQMPPKGAQADPIYENIQNVEEEESIYANVSSTRRIPLAKLEGYLHKMIGSQDLMQEFTSVPSNVGKSMSDGELSFNKKKNRYRNNLPYNATRVKLLVASPDPPFGADYINANHVHSFSGAVNYIAAQGPKDHSVPTIGHFWRMVLEQQATSVIMVANFMEGDKVKVGEYLRYGGESITVDDMTIRVVSTTAHRYYNTSKVQVWHGEYCHTLTHYHYTAWPDHGVPSEAHTLATMVRHLLRVHNNGSVVVHCSAGIGRTGTVLMVLLMNDMLQLHNAVDPLEVLQHLRECRARLVENVSQYNLAFQIFDELKYGMSTSLPSDSLCNQLKEQLEQAESLFQRVSALPSSLTYRLASRAEFTHRNRDSQILPADTRSVFLEMVNGNSLTQYVNAVRLDSLNQPNKILVTEHPMPRMLEQFWRLVVLQHCPSIVLINTYDGYEMDYPGVIPEVEEEMAVGSLMVRTLGVDRNNSVLTYTVQVYPQQDPESVWSVTLYQLTCWPCVEEEPSSLQDLLSVALTLFEGDQLHQPGPILLSCKDGVTGCGVLAGVMVLLERHQQYQTVDVYRTAVLLRRARPQFFTDHRQLCLLYRIASLHLSQYETYINITV